MIKNYILLAVITAVVVAALAYVFMSAGSPFAERARKMDQTRLSFFNVLENQIMSYYSKNKSLPQSLADAVKDTYYANSKSDKDPETGNPFGYVVKADGYSYDLCATFSTASDGKSGQDYYSYGNSGPKTHKKGYDCITYAIPDYLRQRQATNQSSTNPFLQLVPQR